MRDEAQKYYFSSIKIYEIIDEARKACLVCNAVPDKKKMGKFSGHRETVIPRELLMGDCIDLGNMSAGKQKYCFTVVDHSSKYAWVYLIKHKDAYTIRQCLEEIHDDIDIIDDDLDPKRKDFKIREIQFDNGPEFNNNTVHEWGEKHNILVSHGRPWTPQD